MADVPYQGIGRSPEHDMRGWDTVEAGGHAPPVQVTRTGDGEVTAFDPEKPQHLEPDVDDQGRCRLCGFNPSQCEQPDCPATNVPPTTSRDEPGECWRDSEGDPPCPTCGDGPCVRRDEPGDGACRCGTPEPAQEEERGSCMKCGRVLHTKTKTTVAKTEPGDAESEADGKVEYLACFDNESGRGYRIIEQPVGNCFIGAEKTIALFACGEPHKYGPMIAKAMNAMFGSKRAAATNAEPVGWRIVETVARHTPDTVIWGPTCPDQPDGRFGLPLYAHPPRDPEPEGDGWRTMDSAPKDGVGVDLWTARGYRLADARWVSGRIRHLGHLESGWVDVHGTTHSEDSISHWRPLPPAPTLKQEGGR